jgi:arginyl-tRNA synthetase
VKRDVTDRIVGAVREVAAARGLPLGDQPTPSVERPKKAEHGDFTTNVALAMAKRAGEKPVALAQEIAAALRRDSTFTRVDVAGPGFVNVALAPAAFHRALEQVLAAGRAYGRAPAATGERVNLEFVSANPTGPLHMAHGRGAVAGDVVARLLEAAGHRVTREYYLNDFGNQVRLLEESVRARMAGAEVPEGGYGGAYVTTLAAWAHAHLSGVDSQALAQRLVTAMVEGYAAGEARELGIRRTLQNLGIHFDVWSSEEALHRRGKVDRALETLGDGGWLREEDGALFFASTAVKSETDAKGGARDDDKDRVLRKRDGGHTYFASDIAYHKDKLDRGFDRLIDVWGADHHGYVARVRAALRALGLPDDRFEVLLVQMVSLLKDGQPYRMGKRLGNFITIDEVLEEIDEATGRPGAGRDALRYYFCARRTDAQLEIDVEIAKKQSLDNPVYYLQYGHARLCAILRKAEVECGIDRAAPASSVELARVAHPDELAIVALLSELPDAIAEAARERAPQRIVAYLTGLAQSFQSYYTRLKKEGDTILPRTPERTDGSWKTRDGGAYAAKVRARVAWVRAIRDVYAAGLELLGIGAPERMDRPKAASESEATGDGDESSEHD